MEKRGHYTNLTVLAKGDMRYAERDGHVYLFDNSGGTPDHTDDGPCRLIQDEPLEVTARSVYARVYVERTGGSGSCGMSHAAALKLLQLMDARNTLVELHADDNLAALRALLAKCL